MLTKKLKNFNFSYKMEKPTSTRRDFFRNLLAISDERDPIEGRKRNYIKNKAKLLELTKNLKVEEECIPPVSDEQFQMGKFFVSFWLLDSCEDWDHATLLQIYQDEFRNLRCKFYDGTQKNLREVNDNDMFSTGNPVGVNSLTFEQIIDVPVELLDARAIRFTNTVPHLTTDDLRSTMRIQDDNDNLGICQFFTDFDGSADDAHYGSVENLSMFRRLPARPNIQMNDLPSEVDWTNPVNQFNYVNEFNFLLGMPQKAVSLQQINYLGWQKAEELRIKFLTTGVERVAQVSDKKRGGKYLGVWKTQFPDQYPVTTIHTQEIHKFNPGSIVHIHGFKKEFKILNGAHKVSSLPPTFAESTPEPWQFKDSREYYIHIQVDTSNIECEYKPCRHGTPCIKAQHGPVTATTEYRDFWAALYDYNVTVWGPGTHSRIRSWIDENFQIPETWAELKAGIADTENGLVPFTNNFRTYTANLRETVYHNPTVQSIGVRFPAVNINDPFGLGNIESDEKYNYDIDKENYLDHNRTYSLFWTVTGPVLENEPLTSMLLDLGYPSNGSQVAWTVNPWGVFPEPLIDEFGTHDYRLYGAADDTTESILTQLHKNFIFGMVDEQYTCGKKIGYIRIGDELSFDLPFLYLTTRSLVFGRNDMPFNRIKSNCIFGVANCVAKLNEFGVERIILDIRSNGGGFAHLPSAFAVPFGGNRIGFRNALGFPGTGNRDPLPVSESGFKTGFDTLQINNVTDELINTDELYNLFPQGVFRGTQNNRKELVILNSTQSASGGDMLPRAFVGTDANSQVHDIGGYVTSWYVGDINGVLWSGIKAFDGIAVNTLGEHNLYQNNEVRSSVYLACEAGLLNSDAIGDEPGNLVNPQVWTQPKILLHSWYSETIWQDLGLIKPRQEYPIENKGKPNFDVRESWRDVNFEYAIAKNVI